MPKMRERALKSRKPQRGFTLVELLITIAVLAVILVLATPSFTGIINNNRITKATNELAASFAYARSEAVRRNGRIHLVPPTGDWSDGYKIGIDSTADNDLEDNTDIVLRNVPAQHATVTVNGTDTYVVYGQTGSAESSTKFKFTADSADTRVLTLNLSGSHSLCIEKGGTTCTYP